MCSMGGGRAGRVFVVGNSAGSRAEAAVFDAGAGGGGGAMRCIAFCKITSS